MKFTAYIQRQKNLIRRRHGNGIFVSERSMELPLGDRDRLLDELENLKGLNKAERLSLSAFGTA